MLRWNFRKSRWEQFTKLTELAPSLTPPTWTQRASPSANCCTLPHESRFLVDAINQTRNYGGAGGEASLAKFFATLEKCVGHSLNYWA